MRASLAEARADADAARQRIVALQASEQAACATIAALEADLKTAQQRADSAQVAKVSEISRNVVDTELISLVE